jgi:hypothetical protein
MREGLLSANDLNQQRYHVNENCAKSASLSPFTGPFGETVEVAG